MRNKTHGKESRWRGERAIARKTCTFFQGGDGRWRDPPAKVTAVAIGPRHHAAPNTVFDPALTSNAVADEGKGDEGRED